MPSIKNKIEFDIFANSTWIGMQIIQVLKAWDYHNLCGFIIKCSAMEVNRINQIISTD